MSSRATLRMGREEFVETWLEHNERGSQYGMEMSDRRWLIPAFPVEGVSHAVSSTYSLGMDGSLPPCPGRRPDPWWRPTREFGGRAGPGGLEGPVGDRPGPRLPGGR